MNEYMYVFDSTVGQFKIEFNGFMWNLYVRDEWLYMSEDAEYLAKYAEIFYTKLGHIRIGEPDEIDVPQHLDGWVMRTAQGMEVNMYR